MLEVPPASPQTGWFKIKSSCSDSGQKKIRLWCISPRSTNCRHCQELAKLHLHCDSFTVCWAMSTVAYFSLDHYCLLLIWQRPTSLLPGKQINEWTKAAEFSGADIASWEALCKMEAQPVSETGASGVLVLILSVKVPSPASSLKIHGELMKPRKRPNDTVRTLTSKPHLRRLGLAGQKQLWKVFHLTHNSLALNHTMTMIYMGRNLADPSRRPIYFPKLWVELMLHCPYVCFSTVVAAVVAILCNACDWYFWNSSLSLWIFVWFYYLIVPSWGTAINSKDAIGGVGVFMHTFLSGIMQFYV